MPSQRMLLIAIVIIYLAGVVAKLWQPNLDLEHLGEDAVITGLFALLRTEASEGSANAQ